ncbi:flagellar biosynthetic protein FliR [Chromatium okenii]|uniref:flagellar biosynthetic protein FliR n=1 Tax=Chromatium okenii TaxID=61644 RepID=UPI001904A5D2|nr:flagellar biosynthetic protein FliR [Chromatium okenii]MBK1641870.1 flagellar biosynthetic protein FliR [Chromatium okenii]
MSPLALTTQDLALWVGAWLWTFVRISAALLVAPLFGARTVNVRVRIGLGLLLALVVVPQLQTPPVIDPLSLEGVVVAIRQVLIGISMGFVLQMVFSALTQAGEYIALSMGLGFASAMDPVGGVQVPMISQFLTILVMLIFLALNGHLVFIQLLLKSFESIPVTSTGLLRDDLWAIVTFGHTMFSHAVLIALPAMASLLLVNLAMGVVTRASPQLNIFAIGFPLTILAGFFVLVFTLPNFPARIGELLLLAFDLIQQMMSR